MESIADCVPCATSYGYILALLMTINNIPSIIAYFHQTVHQMPPQVRATTANWRNANRFQRQGEEHDGLLTESGGKSTETTQTETKNVTSPKPEKKPGAQSGGGDLMLTEEEQKYGLISALAVLAGLLVPFIYYLVLTPIGVAVNVWNSFI